MANTEKNRADMIRVGAGIAAIAATAYFFLGPDGKRHQKKMKGWMVKMKGEVLEKLEEVQDLTEPIYNEIVDTVARAQEVNERIPKDEIYSLANDLKKQWRTIVRTATGDKKKVKRVAKKTKRAAKSSNR
jgi:hypothetical protein